jgi:hypothetical protein
MRCSTTARAGTRTGERSTLRPGYEALFGAAEMYAERNRLGLSALIAVALEEYLDRERAEAE